MKKLVVVITAIVFVALLISSTERGTNNKGNAVSTNEHPKDTDLGSWAYTQAKEHVREQLKCPSAAKFPFFASNLSQFKGQIYLMTSYVDSDNSFGATVRTHFIIKLQFAGGDKAQLNNWKVLLFETL